MSDITNGNNTSRSNGDTDPTINGLVEMSDKKDINDMSEKIRDELEKYNILSLLPEPNTCQLDINSTINNLINSNNTLKNDISELDEIITKKNIQSDSIQNDLNESNVKTGGSASNAIELIIRIWSKLERPTASNPNGISLSDIASSVAATFANILGIALTPQIIAIVITVGTIYYSVKKGCELKSYEYKSDFLSIRNYNFIFNWFNRLFGNRIYTSKNPDIYVIQIIKDYIDYYLYNTYNNTSDEYNKERYSYYESDKKFIESLDISKYINYNGNDKEILEKINELKDLIKKMKESNADIIRVKEFEKKQKSDEFIKEFNKKIEKYGFDNKAIFSENNTPVLKDVISDIILCYDTLLYRLYNKVMKNEYNTDTYKAYNFNFLIGNTDLKQGLNINDEFINKLVELGIIVKRDNIYTINDTLSAKIQTVNTIEYNEQNDKLKTKGGSKRKSRKRSSKKKSIRRK